MVSAPSQLGLEWRADVTYTRFGRSNEAQKEFRTPKKFLANSDVSHYRNEQWERTLSMRALHSAAAVRNALCAHRPSMLESLLPQASQLSRH
ncbi:unnamed protein product, partial [Iphiclides podalirius]